MKRLLPILLLVFSVGVGAETIKYANGSTYIGQVSNGIPHGQGTKRWPSGAKYIGEFRNGKENGQGTLIFGKGVFEGSKYVGEFKDSKQHGQGTYTWPDGEKYVGEYKDSRPWKGTAYDKAGNIIAIFSDGVPQ